MDRDSLVELTPIRSTGRPTGSGDLSRAAEWQSPPLPPPLLFDGEAEMPPSRPIEQQQQQPLSSSFARREDLSYIWGTGIAVETFREEFQNFLETFEICNDNNDNSVLETGERVSCLLGSRRGTTKKYFLQELLRLRLQNRNVLEVDLQILAKACPRVYQQVISHPMECLQMMGNVAEEVSQRLAEAASATNMSVSDDYILRVAPKNLPETISLRALGPQHLEQLIALQGMVVRVSKIIPEIRVAFFQCWFCQHVRRSVVDRGRIFEPTRCDHCGKQYSYKIHHNLSLFEDKQLVRLQEAPEHLTDGETPVTISLVVYGDSVDAVVPGDRVIVTGIYRAAPVRLNSNTRIIRSIFATHVDAVHIEHRRAGRNAWKEQQQQQQQQQQSKTSSSSTTTTTANATSNGETLEEDPAMAARFDVFRRIASRPDIYNILLNSFARTIWGNEDTKRGILSQLFGGTRKELKSGTFRAEINVLLCGDPGVAKSQLLTQVHEIAPRGVYTSGKGSSSVGLTAYVVQNHETGELVLEPGALVLSDRGLCCIDEFDKMNEATRSVLHEVMEQQTLSIAKAGIVAQLNARTSVLAAANPKESQWNVNLNVVENLQIEPTLLSRFDLIFLLLDRHDPAEDRRLASHVLSLFMEPDEGRKGKTTAATMDDANNNNDNYGRQSGTGGLNSNDGGKPDQSDGQHAEDASGLPTGRGEVVLEHEGEVFLEGTVDAPYMPPRILSQYIALARETVHPRLTEASHKQLATSYVEMRRARGGTRTVSATLRQLESMIRLAEARCKMRFGASVSVEDVREAKWLISAALKEAATDPQTGLINLDMFSAPDPTRQTVEGSMMRLEHVIDRRYRPAGRSSATVNELRLALNEALGGGVRPLAPTQFMELLALMAGGEHIKSFTATSVTFADKNS
ncbi:putative minichromosome maintenance (MCM) complex subunit [Trypanosoma theileri]|uniref:DNA replication licensing factor MCM4 n=1 Tax=Trypanosoma theileri TaxID=67003 RepID=A0A1X0NNF6_9TRYP|nr:putative minichromosome maintenance (MCM) complex subunit [Trypanosoma theileri]ORC86033.1 putative minichromosome maintenance (MCM) complex subunit [Trypanosoma theileri]